MVGLIIGFLNLTPPFRLINSGLHRGSNRIGIHDDLTVGITGSPPNGLNQGAFITQEAFLIRIQNCDQRNFRNVQTFPQQVDSDQHIEFTQPEFTNDLRSFQGLDVTVQILDF